MRIAILFTLIGTLLFSCQPEKKTQQPEGPYNLPAEDFFLARNYPDASIDVKAYTKALKEARESISFRQVFKGFEEDWIVRGPANLGARINTVAVHPNDEDIIYVGFSRGGVWRTTDGGINWEPIFDDQLFLAIGDIEFDSANPDIIYVGTGDPNISSHPGIGNGVYKSQDGGDTWEHLGLAPQCIISQVRVHPENPDIVFAAAMGLPFERNNERGLYRSDDAGQSWSQVLFISDQAGIIDMALHPTNPDIIYAAGWDRIRSNTESIITGTGAKIYKTTNGGNDWEMLNDGLPLQSIGRIGLAVTPAAPDAVYALYVGNDSQFYDVFRSNDAGDSWVSTEPEGELPGLGGFGWYFGKIEVSPSDPEDFFVLGVDLWRTVDGGATYFMASPPWWSYEVHADKHDLVFLASGNILLATDGGLYRSDYETIEWEDIESIPTTQFYRVAYNPHLPDHYYGGAQDNGTTGGTDINDIWDRIYGGDGFQPAFRPDNPDVMYAETQRGGIVYSDSGGNFWDSGTDGIDGSDRRDWDMPYFISPHNPDVLYTGTYRVYRSTNGIKPQWEPISEDLTDGIILASRYHVITTLDESPITEGKLYVGTVDANVWRSDNGGASWNNVSDGLPVRYVTSVKASPTDDNVVYVAHSGYKDNDFIPHIHRSGNGGEDWEDISSNLPALAINDIYILPNHQDSILFVATDGGVYGTMDAGESWERLGANMPYIPVYDMVWNEARNELVVGSFARSIMSYPIDSLLVQPMDTVVVNTEEFAMPERPALNIYPSPATDMINLEFENIEPGKSYEVAIIDAQGRLVNLFEGDQQQGVKEQIDIAQLTAGWYTVKVKMRHEVKTSRFVKQ
jgi:photosystem II stability/assembly factor-like uncharacterized protein